ncbi:hypothetical protein, partial [Inconstantimicrobium porci]|uniref:hypothetical protein n=1 Tax=Inconstantimicrobium porci TaxID=2652291 RepID=UPI002409DE47
MIIKSIIKELYKKKLNSLLIILQLVITALIFAECFKYIEVKDIPKKQAQQLFDDNYKNIYKIEISNSSDSEEFGKIFSDFDKKLTQTFGEKSIGGYHLTNTAYKELSENEDFLKKLVIGEISVLVICA